MATRRAVKVRRSSFEPRELAELAQKVREAGALPLQKIIKLCPTDLDPETCARLIAQLSSCGLEQTVKLARIPLSEQLRALLAPGERVPLKVLPKRLKGATATEVKSALTALIKSGSAHVVVRGKNEALVGDSEAVVGREGMARILGLQKALTELGKKIAAKGGPRTVLAADLELLFAGVTGVIEQATREGRATKRATGNDDSGSPIQEALQRLGKAQHGLVSLPALVRAAEGVSIDAVHAFVLAEEKAGRIELRVETSAETLLSAEDRALCIHSPSGDVLSYALVLRGAAS